MDLKILAETDNPLLKRREVRAAFTHTGEATPQRKAMLIALSKTLKAKEDLIIVDKIFTTRGSATSEARVYVYAAAGDVPSNQAERQKRRIGEEKAKPAKGEAPSEPKEASEETKDETPEKPAEETPKEAPAEPPAEETKEEKKE